MKNMKVLVASCLLAVSVLFSSCSNKEKNKNVATRVDERNKPVTTITEVTEIEKSERLRDYVYETNEVFGLSENSDYVYSTNFVFVRATLAEYNCYGYNENKYIDKEDNNYLSEMTLQGIDGTEITAYLGCFPVAHGEHYNETGYIIGDETNIKDYVGKEVVVYGRFNDGELAYCDVVLSSDVDSLYEKKMNEIEERENTVYTSEMLVQQYNENRIEFYRMFQYHDIKFELKCIDDDDWGGVKIATLEDDGVEICVMPFKHDETNYNEGDVLAGKGLVNMYIHKDDVRILMYDSTEQE